jgi:tetraacyldisaccharide 4'-kinase
MKNSLYFWLERYLFNPTPLQWIIVIAMLPLSLIYTIIMIIQQMIARPQEMGIPVISIGNLTLGGSGKTPFTIALAKELKGCAVVLRGYGRDSEGLLVVSHDSQILEDVTQSGDEAMLYATMLPNSTVIVCEDRIEGINKAKELGAKVILLDDGFRQWHIKKFDILLEAAKLPGNPFPLPAGGYRFPLFFNRYAQLTLKEGIDFHREVEPLNPSKEYLLLTAISKPERLDPYLPSKVVAKVYRPDHHFFSLEEIHEIQATYPDATLLTTQKDAVKLKLLNIEYDTLELSLVIAPKIRELITQYRNTPLS